MFSLVVELGGFSGAGCLEGGSGGLTGGLQIACFSEDLVLLKPSESPVEENNTEVSRNTTRLIKKHEMTSENFEIRG